MKSKSLLKCFAPIILLPLLMACGNSSGDSTAESTQIFRTYTFEGNTTEIVTDGGGIIASGGYSVGDNVSAKFALDFTAQAKITMNSGEIVIPENPQMTNNPHWYFYAKYINGTLIP